jgi:hypothetical protein
VAPPLPCIATSMAQSGDLARLRQILQDRYEEYHHAVEVTTQLLLAEFLDREALDEQHQRERQAFERYRLARTAFLKALEALESKGAA